MAQILIRATDDMKAQLQNEAKRLGITMNALLVVILQGWLREAKDMA